MELLDFRILGPLEVRQEGCVLPLGGQKQRALLALLVLAGGRTVSRERLIDALWGERPPRTAGTSLQNLLSRLRKILGPEVLVTRPPGYALEIERRQLDSERFVGLVESARSRGPKRRAEALRQALDLWRGPPLADLYFESFAQPEIARLEELRLAAVEDRIEAEAAAGADAELVGELESLVREHPTRERLRAQLMRALYRSGRQADALQEYHRARSSLLDELGIEPSPTLQQLHSAILRQEAGLKQDRAAAPQNDADHVREVLDAILSGRLVPVLGADVAELAERLAMRFDYADGRRELTRVSQHVAVMQGSGPLYDELHALLEREVPPTAVHRFFAALPPLLRGHGLPHQLIVTTAYDLALEQAFLEAGEEFDVVAYLAAGVHRGKFCHVRPDGDAALIEVPNTYTAPLSLGRRTTILKLHGQVDPHPERRWESFVVTEDDYIDYLAQSDVANALPVGLAATLKRSHFLFLGYAMTDWNLRVILQRLWPEPALNYRSWAVQPEAKALEREFWRRRSVNAVEAPLEDYVGRLEKHLQAEPTFARA